MKIIYLKLYKYKRFMLNNIETLEYSPDKIIQLIVGTNGSGKSSLMDELSPLPYNKKDYHEGGFKEIHIKKNNDLFIITSGKVSSTKHEFILNNINLNTGGTKRIQLELCKEYFNITPLIHEILTNKKNLTDMSIGERKQWLTDISTIDYKYPLSLYKKIQTTYRDVLGGIKLLDSKLATLETMILTDEELKKKEIEIETLKKLLYNVLTNRKELDEIKFNFDELNIINNRTESLLKSYVRIPKTDVDDLKLCEHIYNKLKNDEEIYLKKLSNINDIENNNKSELLKRKEILDNFIKSIPVDKEDIDLYITFFNNDKNILSYLNQISEYIDVNMSNNYRININEVLLNLGNAKHKLETNLSEIYSEFRILERLKNNEQTECPKCNHNWIPGFNKNRFDLLRTRIFEIEDNIKKLNEDIEKYKYKHDRSLELNNIYNNLITYLKNINILDFANEKLLLDEHNINQTLMLFNELSTLKENIFKLKKSIVELAEIKKSITNIEHLESIMRDANTLTTNELEDKINEIYLEQMKIKHNIDVLKKKVKLEKEIRNNYDNLKTLRKRFKTFKTNEYNKLLNSYIEETSSFLHIEIKELESVVNNIKFNKKTLKTLKTDKEELLSRRDSLKILLDVMSPSEGLIAESILSFIGVFLERINDLINRIWTYDMKLIIPEIDETNDLDYKFKVLVENDNEPIDDIKLVSSGMKEVINLSHRLIVMQVLGLESYPVYLDEFGSKFDPLHKDKTIEIIKDLSLNYEQIFIISHSQEIFNIFSDCNISVLSSDNLFMNDIKKYNEVLRIN